MCVVWGCDVGSMCVVYGGGVVGDVVWGYVWCGGMCGVRGMCVVWGVVWVMVGVCVVWRYVVWGYV